MDTEWEAQLCWDQHLFQFPSLSDQLHHSVMMAEDISSRDATKFKIEFDNVWTLNVALYAVHYVPAAKINTSIRICIRQILKVKIRIWRMRSLMSFVTSLVSGFTNKCWCSQPHLTTVYATHLVYYCSFSCWQILRLMYKTTPLPDFDCVKMSKIFRLILDNIQ